MNVSCPECRSVFRVDPAKVPEVGVRARCSVCGGIFRVAGASSMNEDFADAPRVPSRTPAMTGSVSSDATAGLTASVAEEAPTAQTESEGQWPNAEDARGAAEPHTAPATEGTPAFALPALPALPDSPAPVQPAAAPTSFPAPPASTPSPAQWATTAPAEERATTPPPAVAPASPWLPAAPLAPAATTGTGATRPSVPRSATPFVPGRAVGSSTPWAPTPAVPRQSAYGSAAPASARMPRPTPSAPPTSVPLPTPHPFSQPAPAVGGRPASGTGSAPNGSTDSSSQRAAQGTVQGGAPAAPRRPINPFLTHDPDVKARRLARALVSDMVTYHPKEREAGLQDGTLRQRFKEEIKKSYEEYVEQIGKEFAESTSHFQDALNDILAGGQRVF